MTLLDYIQAYGSEITYDKTYARLSLNSLVSLLLGAGKLSHLALLSDISTIAEFNGPPASDTDKQHIFSVIVDGSPLRRSSEAEAESPPTPDSIYHDVFRRGYYVKNGEILPLGDPGEYNFDNGYVQYMFKDVTDFILEEEFGQRLEKTQELRPLYSATYALTHYFYTLSQEMQDILSDIKNAVSDLNDAYSQLDSDFQEGIDNTVKSGFIDKFNELYNVLSDDNLINTLEALRERINIDDVEVANVELGKVGATIQALGTMVNGLSSIANYSQGIGTLFGAKWQTAAGVLSGAIQTNGAIVSSYQAKIGLIQEDIKRILETL